MKALSFALAVVLLASAAVPVSAQSVAVTPKKTVYRRPKPIIDFKRTFSIRRPVVRAATSRLSRAITAAVAPERILEIDLKQELGEYQWLEEADYKVVHNGDGLLCMQLWMTGTAAYPDSVTRYVVVDVSNARRVKAVDLFTNLPELAAKAKAMQQDEIAAAAKEMKADPENADVRPEQLFENADFAVKDLESFYVDPKGVTFVYDYGFPHVLSALEPAGEFRFSWARLKPFIRRGGLLARFVY